MGTLFVRYRSCIIMHKREDSDSCGSCEAFRVEIKKKAVRSQQKLHQHLNTPAKPCAPLSKTHRQRVELALKQERLKASKCKKDLELMKSEIMAKGIEVSQEMSDDFNEIMTEYQSDVSPFTQLFWQQQQKAAKANGSIKCYPMIIRFCLSLGSKSSSAYDELCTSKVLTLPCRRTLRDYRNAIKPSAGFNSEIVAELIQTAQSLTGYQRYAVLSFDEVKIKENLVFDKYSGNLIGYVDFGDPELNFSSFNDVNDVATHVLVYYVRGLASNLKFSLAYFGTKGVTSYQIMPTFWEAVAILEMKCGLKVIAAVSDGASPNRKFYKMHHLLDEKDESEAIVHRTINLFAATQRYIWFFADAPHLMKTTRNCLYHSGMLTFSILYYTHPLRITTM